MSPVSRHNEEIPTETTSRLSNDLAPVRTRCSLETTFPIMLVQRATWLRAHSKSFNLRYYAYLVSCICRMLSLCSIKISVNILKKKITVTRNHAGVWRHARRFPEEKFSVKMKSRWFSDRFFSVMLQWSSRSPRLWHEFVNHEVCVTTGDQQRFEGRVFTVDPVSAR